LFAEYRLVSPGLLPPIPPPGCSTLGPLCVVLSGYAFEALDFEEQGDAPDLSAVREFIEAAAKAQHEEHPAVGCGRDVRFEADGISGYALIGEEGAS
jgi:ARG and Rhodanese-Phosphatase-superfamily-associated Protein domain